MKMIRYRRYNIFLGNRSNLLVDIEITDDDFYWRNGIYIMLVI